MGRPAGLRQNSIKWYKPVENVSLSGVTEIVSLTSVSFLLKVQQISFNSFLLLQILCYLKMQKRELIDAQHIWRWEKLESEKFNFYSTARNQTAIKKHIKNHKEMECEQWGTLFCAKGTALIVTGSRKTNVCWKMSSNKCLALRCPCCWLVFSE